MHMMGMDFLGPITPVCQQTSAKYILVLIDYFSQFIWAVPVQQADTPTVIHVFKTHIGLVFGWPHNIFSDNGSHFTSNLLVAVFQEQGVFHVTAPTTHPQSVSMIERAVQMALSLLRRACAVDRSRIAAWSIHFIDALPALNS